MEKKLINKKVAIQSKSYGTGMFQAGTYKGTVVALWQDGHCTFIELDSGELINTLYIASITILD